MNSVPAACSRGTDGPSHRALYDGSDDMTGQTRWSPDGTRIAYGLELEGRAGIFVMNADGTGQTQVTNGVWDVGPVWSPDGTWLAYYSDVDADVWVVPSTGGEPRQLTSGPPFDRPEGWTPDGTGVVIQREVGNVNQTMVVPLAGGEPWPLVDRGDARVFAVLSPDGQQVAWQETITSF